MSRASEGAVGTTRAALLGARRPRLRLWRFPCRRAGPRQGGDRLLHDGERPRVEARRRARACSRRCCRASVAVALVGVAALVFDATAAQMNTRRRRAGAGELRRHRRDRRLARRGERAARWSPRCAAISPRRAVIAGGALFAGAPWRPAPRAALGAATFAPRLRTRRRSMTAECGHAHAPDPRQLGEGFSWRGAAGDSRRGGLAALLGGDPRARVRARAGRVPRRASPRRSRCRSARR